MICSFCLIVAVRALVSADAFLRYTSMFLGRKATNKQTKKRKQGGILNPDVCCCALHILFHG